MEKRVVFQSNGLKLEGSLATGNSNLGMVVSHPHSLYGGDMDNPVVTGVARVFSRAGFSCLRFNFRGVGDSGGVFDNGNSEQEDVLAAVDVLRKTGCSEVILAGYSFGAWVNGLTCLQLEKPLSQIMISPPVQFLDFSLIKKAEDLLLVAVGDKDEFTPLPLLQSWLENVNSSVNLDIIAGADHFFSGKLDRLWGVLNKRIAELFL